MTHHNHASIWRNLLLGAMLASTVALLACGASRMAPGGSMPGGPVSGTGGSGGTMPGGGMGQHPAPRPHP